MINQLQFEPRKFIPHTLLSKGRSAVFPILGKPIAMQMLHRFVTPYSRISSNNECYSCYYNNSLQGVFFFFNWFYLTIAEIDPFLIMKSVEYSLRCFKECKSWQGNRWHRAFLIHSTAYPGSIISYCYLNTQSKFFFWFSFSLFYHTD